MADFSSNRPRFAAFVLAALVWLALALVSARAEENHQTRLEAWRTVLTQHVASLKREGIEDVELDNLRIEIERIKQDAAALAASLKPQAAAIERRLKQLAPESDDTAANESPELQAERDAQNKELAGLEAIVKQSQVIGLQSQEILNAINERRRDNFTRKLLGQDRSIFNPRLWREALESLPPVLSSLKLLIEEWSRRLVSEGRAPAISVLIVALLLALAMAAPFRQFLLRFTVRDPAVAEPRPLKKATAAAWITLVNAVIPAFAVFVVSRTMSQFGVMPERVGATMNALMLAAGFFGLANGLGRAILAPNRPGWRLIPLPDVQAERLGWIVFIAAAVYATGIVLDGLSDVLLAPLPLIVALGAVIAISISVLMILGLRTITRGLVAIRTTEGARQPGAIWNWLLPVGWLATTVSLVASTIGYVALGWFVATQIVWTTTILGVLVVLLLLTDELFVAAFRAETRFGAALMGSMGFASQTLEQIAVVLSGLVRLFLIVIVSLLILAPWGIDSDSVLGSAKHALFGFQIGGITVSISTVFLGLLIFLAGIIVTRAIQRWLDARFLPHTRLDAGLKNSIHTGFGYVGFIAAAMIAFSSLGFNLEKIAIVAGALSVGIGFGLQSIVNNFVSGLILLAERPIKTGDWIVVGNEQGYVRKINVRATELETFDRCTVIIPNSDLISGMVKNWMHRDTTGRIIIPVGVAYSTDPDDVKKILLDCASHHPMVMAYPEPRVMFVNFGESSLDFELRCYLSNIDFSLSVSSDLRFAILKSLREAGIEIPFPQRDLNLHGLDPLEMLAKALGEGKITVPKTKTPPKMPPSEEPV